MLIDRLEVDPASGEQRIECLSFRRGLRMQRKNTHRNSISYPRVSLSIRPVLR